ncbi:extracellular solute-binding protein family 3 [Paenibacillus vortex V453]|uniref:ABC transporter substrate-binding protein n=2 Tax=Paenibacillus TaxID=44249 RepID=A0A163KVG8_9BACL|nr:MULTISPECIES: transporter substrate-binding domain-containing protein [Paenibacillus]EFU41926.1 extracellular solute-binding protein family 3 [Paenibacillus vortex V453]KZS47554.1 ABC transporter substrate-binding protein [Paenibacillus glucanolyticus]
MRGTKSIQRIRLLSLFTLIGSIMLAGCTVNSNDRVPTPNMGVNPYRVNTGYLLRNAVERGTLRIATERDYPPFSYHGTGGRLTGFDVEVAEEVARHMELKAEFVETEWKNLLPGLTEGKYDAVFNQIEDRPDRRALYDFSVAYLSSTPVLLVRSGEDQVRTFPDIKGKRVGLNPTGTYNDIAKKHGAIIVPVKYIYDAARMLARSELDAIISDPLSVTNLKQQFPDMPVTTVQSANQAFEVSAAFVKGNPDLVAAVDNALATMQQDGTYLTIWNKYFGDAPSSYKGIHDRKNK